MLSIRWGTLFVYFLRAGAASFLTQIGQIVVTLTQSGKQLYELGWADVGELNMWILFVGVVYAGLDTAYSKFTDSAGGDEKITAQLNTIQNSLRRQ